MSTVHEVVTVLCPFERVPLAAANFLRSLPAEDGVPIIPIRVVVGDLTVERSADLFLKHARAYPGYEIMDIRFRPHDGGLYPEFRGTLSVEEGGPGFSRLDLDGAYEPPLGIAGAMLDAIALHHIAVLACRAVLETLKDGFQASFKTGTAS